MKDISTEELRRLLNNAVAKYSINDSSLASAFKSGGEYIINQIPNQDVSREELMREIEVLAQVANIRYLGNYYRETIFERINKLISKL